MTTDATSDPNDGVSVDGTGQNQSDVFRGESHAAESRRGSTEKGISARSVPAVSYTHLLHNRRLALPIAIGPGGAEWR